ncbi:hypothetical protein IWX76_000741 [Pedobacter sp. CAN_A7]|uniref:hypothetical protein n=1 Tax=Pedobacter sp. CAN_A7 TaxID=2787722 RepID=UPI0018C98D19
MKKIVLAVIALIVYCLPLSAQKKSGAIQFETKFNPAAMAEANGMTLNAEMLARMQSSVTPFELLFNATHASYMKVEEIEDSNSAGAGMGRGFGQGGANNRDYYYDLASQKLTTVFELNDTTYFMNMNLGKAPEGMAMMLNRGVSAPPVIEHLKSDETKKILGFDCQKVVIKTTSKRKIRDEEKEIVDETTVWYTKDLGFDFSPNPSLWTEGAVLAIEGKGSSTLATSIEYRNVSARDVTLPKKGTVITPEAYQAKMEARMKAMRERQGNRSGNGIRNIVIN